MRYGHVQYPLRAQSNYKKWGNRSNLIIIVFIAIPSSSSTSSSLLSAPDLGRQINRNRCIKKETDNKTKTKLDKFPRGREKKREEERKRERNKRKSAASWRDKAASCGHSFSCFSARVKGKASEKPTTAKKGKVHREKWARNGTKNARNLSKHENRSQIGREWK